MFNGILITVGTYNIPLKYIKADTYTVTRNIQDLDSYRDANGILHRSALEHVPVKVEFETIPLNNLQLKELMVGIISNYSVAIERKAACVIYVPETDDYVTQDMYMAQPVPKIKFIDHKKNLIQYEQLRLAFIGY